MERARHRLRQWRHPGQVDGHGRAHDLRLAAGLTRRHRHRRRNWHIDERTRLPPAHAGIPAAAAFLGDHPDRDRAVRPLRGDGALGHCVRRVMADPARHNPRLQGSRATVVRGEQRTWPLAPGGGSQDRAAELAPRHPRWHAAERDGRADPHSGRRDADKPRRARSVDHPGGAILSGGQCLRRRHPPGRARLRHRPGIVIRGKPSFGLAIRRELNSLRHRQEGLDQQ